MPVASIGRLTAVAVLLGGVALSAGAHAQPTPPQVKGPNASASWPSSLSMGTGEVRSISVDELQRVAIGNPDVVDVQIVSGQEILLQARSPGTTNVIVWDKGGRREIAVEIQDLAAKGLEQQITNVLNDMNLQNVRLTREQDRLFLVGEVATPEDLARIQQLIGLYGGQVVSLVKVNPAVPPAAPERPPRLVQLAVQIVELNRSDAEQLGVEWQGSDPGTGTLLELTEDDVSDLTTSKALTRFGTNISRTSLKAKIHALVAKRRARILSEPKLVTASGKTASSLIGQEIALPGTSTTDPDSNATTTNVQFRQTGVILKMTPQVTDGPDTRITTKVEAEISDVDTSVAQQIPSGSTTVQVPGFRIRRVDTEVTTRPDETVMIAGLLRSEDISNADQIPALGSLPIVGRLFRFPNLGSSQREIVIAMTPSLLDDQLADGHEERVQAIESALATGDAPPPSDDPSQRYAQQVQHQLSAGLGYPEREKKSGRSGQVRLRLHLARSGGLIDASIVGGSGVSSFDQEALKAAKRQAPYPKFPSDLREEELHIVVPLVFAPEAVEGQLSDAELDLLLDAPPRNYALLVQDKLFQGIQYPERERTRGTAGVVKLRMHLYRDGRLGQAQLAASSGNDAFDREALQAAERQAPYPPFSNDLGEAQDIWIDLPVVFKP